MRGAALLLPLLLVVVLLHATRGAAAAGSGGNRSCTRSCGRMKVPYPFGFSPGCTIQLGCDVTDGARELGLGLGLLVRNVTPRALILDLRPNCSRPFKTSVAALFSSNYAPAAQNALVMSSCSRADHITNCSIPLDNYLGSTSHCDAAKDSIRCILPPNNASGSSFLNKSEVLSSECTGLVSSVSYWDAPGPALLLGALELYWWVEGPCRCSSRANCTQLIAPTTGQKAFRCECPEGFEGDGFIDGAGCRRVDLVSQILRASNYSLPLVDYDASNPRCQLLLKKDWTGPLANQP